MPETLPQPSELVLHLLGSPRVWLGGQGITLPTKKLLGLVAYLALVRPHSPQQTGRVVLE